PSSREYDRAEEIDVEILDRAVLPGTKSLAAAAPGTTAVGEQFEFRFQDSRGVTASATVEDEQGKVDLNTAPPVLIANLFGVSQLAKQLAPKETVVFLDDGGAFRGDADPATIDGAVVVVDPEKAFIEAIAYRKKNGDQLEDCFRGAFLSLILNHTYPAGSFVYDLRGWKLGYHRLWAKREGGFQPRELTKLSSVEAARELAGWRGASRLLP